ncbi:MAG: hypothetical protein K8U57_37095 [Planctomycetes bacterium]|nr:hypothetical protein [Planctomycetota bacterium]
MTPIEAAARALCDADKTAPDPDANILFGNKAAKAWEARVPLVQAVLTTYLASVSRDEQRIELVAKSMRNGFWSSKRRHEKGAMTRVKNTLLALAKMVKV